MVTIDIDERVSSSASLLRSFLTNNKIINPIIKPIQMKAAKPIKTNKKGNQIFNTSNT